MSVAELFIKRPVMTALVMMAILLFGIIAYRKLPVSDLPNVDFPTISVSASLPGASPETMASSVATPLETQFSTIAGLDQMTSASNVGGTQITLQFNLSRSIDAAAQDVQAMIAKAARNLPPGMPSPPSYQKVNPADQPVLFLSLTSPTLRLSDLDEVAESLMAQRISMVSGVAAVTVFGIQKYAVRVQLDPRALASRQIGIDEVTSAVQAGNVQLPTGTLYGPKQAFSVQANGQLTNADEYRRLIVTYRNGSPVRLEQLGNVLDSVESTVVAGWYGEDHKMIRSINMAIQRQPGTNTVEVVDAVKALIPKFKQQMPPSVGVHIIFDRSTSIQDSVHDVKFTLFLSLGLVILVIFLFLRNFSATVIPSLALPMSIVGTFGAMYLLGYTVDNLSLMALTLSVGFVVDDAIVMLENIVRHMEKGEDPRVAAVNGSREIGFTIVSMTLSLGAVFIPVLFMGGILGLLLHEFAVTIGVAILVSGFVSLSLTPMMCSRFLRPSREAHHGRLYAASEKFFDGLRDAYAWCLQRVMRHRVITMTLSAAILCATVYLFIVTPKGFLPSEDRGQFNVATEAAQGISFDDMAAHQKAIGDIFLQSPYVSGFTSNIGVNNAGAGTMNVGRMTIRLIPRQQRPHVDEIIQELRPKLAKVPGIKVFPQNSPAIQIGGFQSRSLYQFTLQSPDTRSLYEFAPKLQARLRTLPGLQDVSSDLLTENPQVNVDINRDRASALGITAAKIESGLNAAYGSTQVSTIFTPNNAYKVILELLPQYQMDPSALSLLYIRSSGGQLVPLNEVANVGPGLGPLQVNHQGQLPAVTLSFNLKPGTPLGDAVNNVQKASDEILPSTISTSFQGTAQAFESSFKGLGLLLLMTILVIYVVLGILYESFIHPITILSGLPAAGFGALLTLQAFHTDLNLYAFVGIIMLVGIVKKNAIMMIDFAVEAERQERKSAAEAIYQGALVRFRPIMMTTMSALVGTLPIALGLGAGGESRRPLGLAVVGGLLFSQVLTLFITPVFYTYMDTVQRWLNGRRPVVGASEQPQPLGAD